MKHDQLRAQIDAEAKKKSASNSIIGDRIDELNKRLMQIKETIERSTAVNEHSGDIGDVIRNASVVCSTLSSAINLKP